MELLKELNVGVYEQYVKGKKCIQLNQDRGVKTYGSSLPSVGVAGTFDLGQAILRVRSPEVVGLCYSFSTLMIQAISICLLVFLHLFHY